MPGLVRTAAQLGGAKPRVEAPEGLGPVLRQVVEQEQADLIAAIREEERARAETAAEERVEAARREALSAVQSADERSESFQNGMAKLEAATAKVEAAAAAMAARIADVLTAAVDQRMADIVEGMTVLNRQVKALAAREAKEPPAPDYKLRDVKRKNGLIEEATFVVVRR